MRRWHVVAVVLVGVAVGLQLPLWRWAVEDAAISFAYARNLAEGHGLVPYPGLERVEGFSNPLWVAILAAIERLGGDAWRGAEVLGLLLAAVTVPSVMAMGRRVGAPVLAGLVAATSAGLAVWSTSGLENPLLLALLAAGGARLLLELDRDREGTSLAPLSAALFAGVALTRPEGLMYGMIAGALVTLTARRRAWWRTAAWWGLLLAPVAAFLALRLWYFALPLPATYYAKLGTLPVRMLAWDARGWSQLRGWFLETGAVALLPVVVLGVTGRRGVRAGVGLGCVLVLWLMLLVPGPEWLAGVGPFPVAPPAGWDRLRGVVFAAVAALVPLAVARRGWEARILAWVTGLAAVAFSVRSQGDWMTGYRFLSVLAVPWAVLLGGGLAELGAALRPSRTDRAWGLRSAAAVGGLIAVWIACNGLLMARLSPSATPYMVKRRLDHYVAVFDRLELDRPFLAVDHDMGGMLWWFDPDVGRVIDSRGLVDLPFALHHRQEAFVAEYLFQRNVFDLAHAHASTGAALRRLSAFRREYVEVVGYGSGNTLHGGNFLRRDLFLRPDWDGVVRGVRLGRYAELVGFTVPSPEVSPGAGLFVEVALAGRRPFRLVAFIAGPDGAVHAWELPPGYDWVNPRAWRRGERFVGRFSLALPESLPLGTYDLGFVAFGPDGEVLPADTSDESPRYAAGEVRYEGIVELVDGETMRALAAAEREEAITAARDDRCEEAEASWERALRHRTRSTEWQRENRPWAARAIALCWARAARRSGGIEAAAHLERARRWDLLAPAVERAGVEVADALIPVGEAALARGDDEGAFAAFEAAVRADPSRSWARRYAEEARARRLGLEIGGVGVDGVEEEPERE